MFPLYIWMVTGLLLIALMFFVFAQAAVTRSGGQSAADSAALAAAHESRDQLYDDFLAAVDDEEDEDELQDFLDGTGFSTESACDAAADLAARNSASVTSCTADEERQGYSVGVETDDTVGQSVVPGTEEAAANALALAVIEGLCTVESVDGDALELGCEEADWDVDTGNSEELPEARDLFRIYLED